MKTAIYLRKSRADVEAEARGEGETLAKHKSALLKLAKTQNVTVIKVFDEIVSGESLFHRPQMNELLKNVEDNQYDAVLIMDLDRLGRGNMQEQGLILETFRKSNTKIITPRKTYDLNNEFDEEYSEFEAFMARKELKMITRRLQGGRVRAIEEGKYLGTRPPYGYDIHFENGVRTLIQNSKTTPIVKIIFDLYTHHDPQKRLGCNKIANQLNDMNIPTSTGKKWDPSSVLCIIKNAVYTGRIQWKKVETKKSKVPGKRRTTRMRDTAEWIDVPGKHTAIITNEQFKLAQSILSNKYHIPYQLQHGITNPLAGVMVCGKCNRKMIQRPYGKQKPHIMCPNRECNNKSSRAEYVEDAVLKSIQQWLLHYEIKMNKKNIPEECAENVITVKKSALNDLENELRELDKQKLKLFDLLERGIYSEELFVERSTNISERISTLSSSLESLQNEINALHTESAYKEGIIPEVVKIISLYERLHEASDRNELLKRVIARIVYTKEKHQRGYDFVLDLFVRIQTDNY